MLWLILSAKVVRAFAFGWLSVVLALFLAGRGLSAAEIGGAFTATMVEDAVLTILLSVAAARVGPAPVMAAAAPLMALGGILLATAESRWLLLAGVVVGTLSPNGQDAGPFAALEQAMLPGAVRPGTATRAFGWYNVAGFLPASLGALAAGAWLGRPEAQGAGALAAHRTMFWGYAVAGLAMTTLYVVLAVWWRSPPVQAPAALPLGRLGLHRSRGAVLELAGLQALDAFAGGFIMQGLLAYWFHLRFGAGPEALGALFFGTNLLSALSFLLATRLADRIGLLNTAVFTHLPSNLLLLIIPWMPSFTWAAGVLLARHLLSQMDVPTRQAYAMALVAPEERPAAAGLTASARALAQACAPAITGAAMTLAATPLPFLLSGGLKIVYDLALFFRFRGVPIGGANMGPGGRA